MNLILNLPVGKRFSCARINTIAFGKVWVFNTMLNPEMSR